MFQAQVRRQKRKGISFELCEKVVQEAEHMRRKKTNENALILPTQGRCGFGSSRCTVGNDCSTLSETRTSSVRGRYPFNKIH
jgi:hypothetical protein